MGKTFNKSQEVWAGSVWGRVERLFMKVMYGRSQGLRFDPPEPRGRRNAA